MSSIAGVEHHTTVHALETAHTLRALRREHSCLSCGTRRRSDASEAPHLAVHFVWHRAVENLLPHFPEDCAGEPRV